MLKPVLENAFDWNDDPICLLSIPNGGIVLLKIMKINNYRVYHTSNRFQNQTKYFLLQQVNGCQPLYH